MDCFSENRIAEIRKLTPVERWYHLPGTSNPADLPSRGCSPKQLLESKWWEGPNWLYEDPEIWPFSNFDNNEEEICAERKKNLVSTLLSVDNINTWHLNHFSGYNKTIRMIAWIFRFLHNCRRSGEKDIGELTAQEYQTAENFVIKLIQQECFSNENVQRISGLNLFYDEDGVIRLKSRVSNREDTKNYHFPVVLPSKHPLVNQLIMDKHVKACHVEYGLPDYDAVDKISLCRKARKIQSLRGDLRARFRTEYLGQLKLKCNEKTGQEIAIGDLVFVEESNSKRMDWPIARVVVFPASI
ncbi:hypothetical protein NQ315_003701 [Exocentrus adspersus]|uniref:DUF5641 domain-containing protein n=1 Tax=Exocentrus adspersus TaxID=1586481 RepID=A0AAV8V6M6_9CUCU|nr:hypothetical protein NQ315_003701 [Exocentrus adspersus]